MALEIANVIHAVGKVQGGAPPALLTGVGLQAAVSRSAAGVYQLQTEIAIDASEAVVFVDAPAFGNVLPRCNGSISAPGIVNVVIAGQQGAGVDPPYFDVEVQRFIAGAVPLPAVTPPVAPTGGQFVNVIDPPDFYNVQPGERVIYTDAAGAGVHPLNLPDPGVPGMLIQVIVASNAVPNVKVQVLAGGEIYNAQPTNDDRVSPAVQLSGVTPLGGKTYEFVGGIVGWLITGFNGQAA